MTPEDQANLEFLLLADDSAIQQWKLTVTDDDLAYAQELLALWDQTLAELAQQQAAEHQLAAMADDYSLASLVLDQFRLTRG